MRVALASVLLIAGVSSTAAAQGRLERVHGRIVVDVVGDMNGVVVLVDGQRLGRERWGVPTRVELGEHRVEARRDGEVVSSTTTVVPRGGDAHVILDVSPPRAVSEGGLRIEPASRPSSMGDGGGRGGERDDPPSEEEDDDEEEEEQAFEPAAEPLGDDDGGGLEIPTWVWWAAGGVAAATLIIVLIAVAASASSNRPVEGDLMPGVLRF